MQHRDNPIMAYWKYRISQDGITYQPYTGNPDDKNSHTRKELVCRICIYRSLLSREDDLHNHDLYYHLCHTGGPLRNINRDCASRHPPEQQRHIKKLFQFNNKVHEIAATWSECKICNVCSPVCLSKMKIYQELYKQVIDQTPRDTN